ncbi:hypothetical protein CBOM_01593 [Ceraceosorus bombacis]|uniref:Myb-like domain-containing protein n=1 Tax=Ceraceosorus bombacis TaxID=401625 RepID=A0A0P1BDN0_9BASI|nr:hypothetical protein CBOM_01593 [Ceraceosorus bombacis]
MSTPWTPSKRKATDVKVVEDVECKQSETNEVASTPCRTKRNNNNSAAKSPPSSKSPKKPRVEGGVGAGSGVAWSREEDELWIRDMLEQYKPNFGALSSKLGE